jgi:hypothetical protein
MSGTEAFFHAMAPTLTANILTVAFVYCFARIAKIDADEGRLHYLWLILMVLLLMLYGLYTWDL